MWVLTPPFIEAQGWKFEYSTNRATSKNQIVGASQVIGIAGSDEKCRWVESLGADVCLNYKKADFFEKLTAATDGFVDVFFDNVGVSRLRSHLPLSSFAC